MRPSIPQQADLSGADLAFQPHAGLRLCLWDTGAVGRSWGVSDLIWLLM